MQTLPHLIFLSLQIYDIISQNQTLQSFVAIISKILFYTNPLQETEPFSKHAHILYFSWKIRHTFFAEFKKCTTFASAIKQHGRLAQLVQSIWFTPRGSGVRIPQRPQESHNETLFLFEVTFSTPWKYTLFETLSFLIVFQKVCIFLLFSCMQNYK